MLFTAKKNLNKSINTVTEKVSIISDKIDSFLKC